MNNFLNLKDQLSENNLETKPNPHKKRWPSRHIFLTSVLLISIAFSAGKISGAAGAPDPGHLWSEIEQVALSIGQGGTGLEILGTTGQLLIVNGAGDALEYQTLDTAIVPENGNLYYTTARHDADFDTRLAIKTTSDLAEGSNLYYTDGRFDSRLALKTTDDLTEGANLYYTDLRARGSLSASSPILYDNVTGAFSLDTVPTAFGGTGLISYNAGDILYASAANTLSALAKGATNQLLGMSAGATGPEYKTLSGTANQITITNGAGTITLAAPQNIHTAALPTFTGLTLSGLGTGIVHANASGVFSSSAVNLASSDVTGILPIGSGGTGQTTANAAFNALAPSQAGQANKFLQTNGANTSWTTIDKTFIGLSNVENIALSTWPGGANIVNLGTIVTGAWQATPIADTYIASSAAWNAKEPAIALGNALQYFRGDKTWQTLDTSVVPENGNLYYTDARFDSRLAGKTTDDMAEGSNLYYTTGRHDADFDIRLAANTTDNLAEGLTNLYYTDLRADARIAAAAGVSIAELIAGKIPSSYLPALAITDTYVVADEPSMLALPAQTGDVAVRTDLNKSLILAGADPASISDWQELLTPTDTVLAVNGQTGVVSLTTDDISESANLYYTDARFDSGFAAKTTDDLAPGAVNKYYNMTIYEVADDAERDALVGMKKGDIVTYTDESKAYIYDGLAWKKLSGV